MLDIEVDLPENMINFLDEEASRYNISRDELVQIYLTEHILRDPSCTLVSEFLSKLKKANIPLYELVAFNLLFNQVSMEMQVKTYKRLKEAWNDAPGS